MASNFFNSSGTDLDSVFYVNNSNAGALGFQVSNGQDLGNRYRSGSLGYNIGYKNSAGTDIGYLRGNVPPITMGDAKIGVVTNLAGQGYYIGYYNLWGTITGGIPPYTVKFDLLTSKAGDTGSKTATISSYITEARTIVQIIGSYKGSSSSSIKGGTCTGKVTVTDSTGTTYSTSVSN